MLNTDIFSDNLKIIPIYKKREDETLFRNYRAISFIPIISKILRKVSLISYMSLFVNRNSFIMPNMVFAQNILFDTIDHMLLLDKHLYYGINGMDHRLLENYLSKRSSMQR